MRLTYLLLALTSCPAFAQSKAPAAPPSTLPATLPAKDAAAINFGELEFKDVKLLNALEVVRAKARHQNEAFDMVIVDPKGQLAGRVVNINMKNVNVGQVMKILSVLADFKYTIKGAAITVEPR